MKKILKFFLSDPYSAQNEKMGFCEELVFNHVWDDDSACFKRNGVRFEALLLIGLTITAVILAL